MNNNVLISNLNKIILTKLEPIIGTKTLLTDCPYHYNIGDLLIWQGELEFLKKINRKPISQSSMYTFSFPKVSNNTTICLHGGGNFGDLYREAQEFRIKIINTYTSNRIVIFPQSVWYTDNSLIEKDAKLFSIHKDLYICARDMSSYNVLKKYFSENKILLVPDMAFFMGDLSKKIVTFSGDCYKSLYFRRLDMEYVACEYKCLEGISDIKDWPGFEGKYNLPNVFMKILMKLSALNPFWRKIYAKPLDMIMQNIIKPNLIYKGIEMLKPYKYIYTTRLHAMILGILLGKTIFILDSKTKKISDYYHTWLDNNESITIVNE